MLSLKRRVPGTRGDFDSVPSKRQRVSSKPDVRAAANHFGYLTWQLTCEHQKILQQQTASQRKIEELQKSVKEVRSRNHALKLKLEADVNNRAQERLQNTEYLLDEMKKEYRAQMQGMEYEIEQKEKQISHLQYHIDLLLNAIKEKEDEIQRAEKMWFIREHWMEKEQEELITEIQVKDHMNEIAHKDNERKNNTIVSQLLDQIHGYQAELKTKDDEMRAELKEKDDEIQQLTDELQTQEFEHDEQISRLEQEYSEKKKQVYSYQSLAMLERKQMMEIQKHLDELLKMESMCSICVDSEKNVAINPCGHQFCKVCAGRFGGRCPVCKGLVYSVISLMRT